MGRKGLNTLTLDQAWSVLGWYCKSTHRKALEVSLLWCGQIQKSILVPVTTLNITVGDVGYDHWYFSWYLHMDMQWWWSLFRQPSSHTVRLSSSSMSSRQMGHICSSSSFILLTTVDTQAQLRGRRKKTNTMIVAIKMLKYSDSPKPWMIGPL